MVNESERDSLLQPHSSKPVTIKHMCEGCELTADRKE
jgi:hypothetical protein